MRFADLVVADVGLARSPAARNAAPVAASKAANGNARRRPALGPHPRRRRRHPPLGAHAADRRRTHPQAVLPDRRRPLAPRDDPRAHRAARAAGADARDREPGAPPAGSAAARRHSRIERARAAPEPGYRARSPGEPPRARAPRCRSHGRHLPERSRLPRRGRIPPARGPHGVPRRGTSRADCAPGRTSRPARDGLRLHCGGTSAYDRLAAWNFSRDFLACVPQHLTVARADDLGWSDWGTPEAIERTLSALRVVPPWRAPLAATA